MSFYSSLQNYLLNNWMNIMQEAKCHFFLEEGQEGGHRKLQTAQFHLSSCKSDRAANPENHFQAHEGQ